MKIFAGWKFHGRKPRATPATIVDIRAATLAWSPPSGVRKYAKNAIAAIATIPAARPSSPSTRFTAFISATIHRTVSGTARSGESESTP